ncbi:MAG: sugar phosphate isomerase/epimerase family protein [Trueperaceae bacterium]|nr:sugar phosphate isomerase/epimerase family protein [Trueperaceae bacterium]
MERLSLNQATTPSWSVSEAIEGCARHGIGWIGLWRGPVAEAGLEPTARHVRESGVRVSSLCRGGFFPAATAQAREERLDDNRRAVDEAATLGTDVLVLVCGGMVGRDLPGSRRMVEDGIAALVPYARERGVRLAIEPLHPMFAADRSVICDLGQAFALADRVEAGVGVVVDAYHVWWDPQLYAHLARGRERILGLHVDDWLAPPPDVLRGRGMMGDGCIDLHGLYTAVDAGGYQGPVEVEIFNDAVWQRPGDEVLAEMRDRFGHHVLRPPEAQQDVTAS